MGTATDPALLGLFREQLAAAVDRGLGDLQLQSNLSARALNQASYRAADNLLGKARRALGEGDRDRAARYVEKATRLPFDGVERAHPAVHEAHMLLFSTVTDALESSATSSTGWLDAAEAALAGCGPHAREDLLQTFRAIDNDYALQGKIGRASCRERV